MVKTDFGLSAHPVLVALFPGYFIITKAVTIKLSYILIQINQKTSGNIVTSITMLKKICLLLSNDILKC